MSCLQWTACNELLKWALFKAKADELEKVKKELAEANARIKELEKENAELTEKYTKEQILIIFMVFRKF